MNKALDEVRAGESRRMAREGRTPLLKKSRWLLLKREENLKVEQRFRLRDLLRYNLKTVRAYLLKEAFQQLWDYSSPSWAGKFLDEWCRQTMRSRIEPMKKIARSLRQHRELILNYFRAQKLISSGVVECFIAEVVRPPSWLGLGRSGGITSAQKSGSDSARSPLCACRTRFSIYWALRAT
jgi:transposase